MTRSGPVKLSVDLGTTWTAAAVSSGSDVNVVGLGNEGPTIPSVVAVVNGEVVAGAAAARAAIADPASSAREFKRRLGDTAPIVLAGTPYGPETLIGHLLAHVVSVATAQVGGADSVTLTHPAVFGEYKLDLMREAGRVAGLASVELLSEPEAAALHYARLGRLSVGDTVAVYDFGGGTFDAAIVTLDVNGPRLLGRPEGLERLGGIDLDHAVLAHVDRALGGVLGALDTANPDVRRGLLALRQECVSAKEALSVDTEVGITVTVPGLDTVVRLTRVEFESFVRPRLGETLNALDRAIASAGLSASDLAGVVLVGGSSRIPIVVEQVGAHTARPLLVDADPKLVVALGAVTSADHQTPLQEMTMPSPTPAPTGEPGSKPTADEVASTGAPGTPAATPGASGGPRELRTAPGKHEPEKGGMSTAGKIAAGAAAVGLAGATAAFWRDDVANAVGLGDDDPQPTPVDVDVDALDAAALAIETIPTAPAEESMDAFDAIADAPVAEATPVEAIPTPVPEVPLFAPPSGGGGGGTRQQRRVVDDDDGPAFAPPSGGSGQRMAPPQMPMSSSQPAMETLPPPPPPPPPSAPAPMEDTAFEAARSQLAARLEQWQAPQGADPAEAAELHARLQALLERFEPRPGQSVDDAIADLRDQFDLRLDNFTQDQKIDALIDEVDDLRHDTPSSDPAFELKRDALRAGLESWKAPDGASPEQAATLKAELQALVDSFQPQPGQSADDALDALRAQFDDEVQDFVQDQKIDALVEEQNRDNVTGGDAAGSEPPGDAPDPRVTMPGHVLVDDFAEMIGEASSLDAATSTMEGVKVATAPAPAPGDEDFSTPQADATVTTIDPSALVKPATQSALTSDDDDVFGVSDMVAATAGRASETLEPGNTGIAGGLMLTPTEQSDDVADGDADFALTADQRALLEVDADAPAPPVMANFVMDADPTMAGAAGVDDAGTSLAPADGLERELDLDAGMSADDLDDPLSGV